MDAENRTVIDVLSDQRSPISLEIGKLILGTYAGVYVLLLHCIVCRMEEIVLGRGQ